MREREQHLKLKEQARQILLNKGFTKNEIMTEYKWERYIIDIVAINKQKRIFIECGFIKLSKHNNLNRLKDKLNFEYIHLPYENKNCVITDNVSHYFQKGSINNNSNTIHKDIKFCVKLRKIGGSVGIIIPYEVIEKLKLKEGEIKEFEILKDNKEE